MKARGNGVCVIWETDRRRCFCFYTAAAADRVYLCIIIIMRTKKNSPPESKGSPKNDDHIIAVGIYDFNNIL